MKHSLLLAALLICFSACKKDKQPPNPCGDAVAAKGRLTQLSDGTYRYQTSGGAVIKVDMSMFIRIEHNDYAGFSIELWGGVEENGRTWTSANHENLNGKHIKDRHGNRRTIIFPDGAKLTLVASGEYEPLISATIYDGEECHRIMAECNTLSHSSLSAADAQRLDNAEADGETAAIEFTNIGLLYVNVYREDVPGNKVEARVPLGSIERGSPNMINDFYDDPRIGHT